MKRLRDLESKLSYSEADVKALKDISETQGEYVNRLLKEAGVQARIYNLQLEYQNGLRRDLRIYTWLFRVGVPLAAAGAGYLGYRLAR
jgi:hypothetical protein